MIPLAASLRNIHVVHAIEFVRSLGNSGRTRQLYFKGGKYTALPILPRIPIFMEFNGVFPNKLVDTTYKKDIIIVLTFYCSVDRLVLLCQRDVAVSHNPNCHRF